MRPLCLHGCDDRRLSVVRGVRSEAYSVTHGRLRTVGPHNEPRRQLTGTRLDTHRVCTDMERYELRWLDNTTGVGKRVEERCLQHAVLDDVPEIGFANVRGVKHQRTRRTRRHTLVPDTHPP